MGFGYLLIGYLITFVLYSFFGALGVGGFALLLGVGIMMSGLSTLCRYHRQFCYAKWILVPMLALAGYDAFRSLSDMMLWNLSLFGEGVTNVINWLIFTTLLLFNIAMLYGIRTISQSLGLLSMAASSLRNMILVSGYALLYVVAQLSFLVPENVKGYLLVPVNLLQILWIICNLLLLLACNKNICAAGDEDQPPRQTRFKWVDRLNRSYEEARSRSIEKLTRETEDKLRRRKERREQRSKRSKK